MNGISANGKVPTRITPITNRMRAVMRAVAMGKQTPKLIAVQAKTDRGTAHRTLQSLVKRGMVTYEVSSRQYFLSRAGKESVLSTAISEVPTDSSKGSSSANQSANGARALSLKRGHALCVKFPILACPKGWRESPKEFFRMKNVDAAPLGIKNVDGVRFAIDQLDFRVTSSSIVMMTREGQYKHDAVALLRWLIPLCFDTKNMLEKLYPQLRLGEAPTIIVGEIGHEEDPVAALRKAEGFHIIRHSDGRARVQFDTSKGPREIEFLHPGMFDADSETWDRRITQLLDSPYDYDMLGVMAEESSFKNEDQDRRIEGLITASQLIVQNQGVFDANMKSHLAVLHKLGAAVDRLGTAVRTGKKTRAQSPVQQSLGRYSE